MTDQDLQEIELKAAIEGKALADVVNPELRGEIWKACATWSAIASFVLFCFYRSDFAELRRDMTANAAALRSDLAGIVADFSDIRDDLKAIKVAPINLNQQQTIWRPKEAETIRAEFVAVQADLIRQTQELARNGKPLQSGE